MSEHDVEVVRRAFVDFQEGLARGEFANAFDKGSASPDLVWIIPPNAPGMRPVYEGREGWIEFMTTWTEDFDWWIEIEELIDVGDGRVVVNTHQRAVGKASGVPVDLHMGAVWTVEGDQTVRMENYFERAEALAAAGLSD